ncbi:phosphoribosylamine--glycine ligase [Candidatus Synechococcus calcipolaris G9]|uniref:Phosphoribosylamine--glycine ligase n=1 Tax=Candidatus Synechococcus calcipolaris G9 TaxID=1497997 RepID=A0ABT6EY09_9SYNE|nr:phosphoribosylamine--glycine ligase [Candidatus Synechococcus calcipolaris]MDG2990126.1 phosphoribosylamine--glycine ligase [Candidatus Synechococcus calcipolaris G9]
MKLIVVGSGGREHALAWKLLESNQIERLFCLPGNGGTACLDRCENVAIAATDLDSICQFAQKERVDLVVIGPEVPLAAGLGDRLQALGIAAFGPTQAGAKIEASKAWAKTLMVEAGIPTARAQTFDQAAPAITYVQAHGAPIVIKADGLAAGKGVTVAQTLDGAIAAIHTSFAGTFGEAGSQVVIEEVLVGEEVSVLALTDGQTIRPLLPAQDHKPIGEGDRGPNTGGMGVYAPLPRITAPIMAKIQATILEPTLAALQKRGIDYRGVLYAGLMIDPEDNVQVVEFNCRFGDPETQVILPLLDTPLLDLLLACVNRTLDQIGAIAWKPGVGISVVMAAAGYPNAYPKGDEITGIPGALDQGVLVFHAGTLWKQGQWLTNGGRVLNVTAVAENFTLAKEKAYGGIAQIQFPGAYYRRDIGYRLFS